MQLGARNLDSMFFNQLKTLLLPWFVDLFMENNGNLFSMLSQTNVKFVSSKLQAQ